MTTQPVTTPHLPVSVDLSYSFLAIPLSILSVPIYLYLPSYYLNNWAIDLATMGLILLVARLIDVVTDPVIGYFSDRLASTISRIWQIVLGTLLLLSGVFILFFPIVSILKQFPITYLGTGTFLTFLGWTLITVPYQSLTAELSSFERERVRLTSFREAFSVFGVVVVLSLPAILNIEPTDPVLFESIWYGLLATSFIAVMLLLLFVNRHTHLPKASSLTPWKTFSCIWSQHRWSLSIMPAYFLNNLANAFPATLFLLFVEHALQLPSQVGIFLMIYFLAGIIALPGWFWLSRKIGKSKAWLSSMILSILSFSVVLTLSPGDSTGYLILCILTGLSLGADLALPAAIQADIAQQLSQKIKNVNGILFGLWGLLTKLALAIAVGFALPLLHYLGIDQQSDDSIQSLWLLYAVIPILLKCVATILLNTNIEKAHTNTA